MRIYTLGTSHGNSTLSRFNSSTVYEAADGSLYLVDAGEPVEALMRRAGLDYRRLHAVFVTHMHVDHANGLASLFEQLHKVKCDTTVSVLLPEEEGVRALCAWCSALRVPPADVCPRSYDEGVVFEDEMLRVNAIRTRHILVDGVGRSFAFLLYFKAEGKSVLHTGDLRYDFSDFPAIAQDTYLDACLCEATHYQPETAMPILMGTRFGRLIFHHVGDRWHLADGSRGGMGEGPNALLALTAHLPYPVTVANDGDIFEI